MHPVVAAISRAPTQAASDVEVLQLEALGVDPLDEVAHDDGGVAEHAHLSSIGEHQRHGTHLSQASYEVSTHTITTLPPTLVIVEPK